MNKIIIIKYESIENEYANVLNENEHCMNLSTIS
jgi:hypothetical protein